MIYPQITFPFELLDLSSELPEGNFSEVGPTCDSLDRASTCVVHLLSGGEPPGLAFAHSGEQDFASAPSNKVSPFAG
jgi:hypothetical protein